MMITTGYNDLNGKEILLGDKVIINANPHYGEYDVKFGEYRLEPFKKHQIEVPHLGFYLTNGETIVSFMYVIKQPTGYASGIHTIEVIGGSSLSLHNDSRAVKEAISTIVTEVYNDEDYREFRIVKLAKEIELKDITIDFAIDKIRVEIKNNKEYRNHWEEQLQFNVLHQFESYKREIGKQQLSKKDMQEVIKSNANFFLKWFCDGALTEQFMNIQSKNIYKYE